MPPWISKGFQLAAFVNIAGILFFSKGFTNRFLTELDPQVFSTFAQGTIILWGLAYLAMAGSFRDAKWVVAVFAVEKLVYGGAWIAWITRRAADLPSIFETSPLTGTFFVIYGPNDLLFAVFFGWVFLKVHRES